MIRERNKKKMSFLGGVVRKIFLKFDIIKVVMREFMVWIGENVFWKMKVFLWLFMLVKKMV